MVPVDVSVCMAGSAVRKRKMEGSVTGKRMHWVECSKQTVNK